VTFYGVMLQVLLRHTRRFSDRGAGW